LHGDFKQINGYSLMVVSIFMKEYSQVIHFYFDNRAKLR